MTMFSFNRVGARPDASARNPSTATSDRQPFAVRLASDVLVAAGILALFGLIAWILPVIGEPIGPKGVPSQVSTHLADLPYYALRSVFRMLVALFFSLVFTFIYGTAAARCRRLSRVLIPLLDILQSVPILGFLSATITIWMVLFPGSMLGVEAASIFAIFTSQAWNMAFSFTRSLTSEPTELDEAARSLQLTRWQRFWTLDVPNAMIPLLWNCMMSVGGGWFFLTASEMISVNNRTYALPGIGSFVAQAAAEENLAAICWAIVTMVLVVLLIDVLLWKPLTAWAEKFRITQSESAVRKTSVVLTIIRQSHIDEMVAWLFRPLGDLFDTLARPLGRTGGRWAADVKSARSRALDVVFTVLVLAAVARFDFAGGIRLVGHGRHYGGRWGVECLDCLGNRKLWTAYADRLRPGRVYRRGHRKRQHREDHHRCGRDERVRGGRQPPVLEPAAAHGRAPFRTELKT